MEYEIEDLLPVVSKLVEKYTSKDSTSVSYDTVHMIMEAVIYCIQEIYERYANPILTLENKLIAVDAYQKGYEIVLDKVLRAKEIYERLIESFEDYGCRHYKDTIIKGMPEFFIWYDAKFKPQDHLLTLDYPIMRSIPNLCGIDLVLEYLTEIEIEKKILDCFDRQHVIRLLQSAQLDYQFLYLDNICYIVLLTVVGCVIADHPVHELKLTISDCKEIELYFKEDDLEQIKKKLIGILNLVYHKLNIESTQPHLDGISTEFATRIWYGIQNESLDGVFHLSPPTVI